MQFVRRDALTPLRLHFALQSAFASIANSLVVMLTVVFIKRELHAGLNSSSVSRHSLREQRPLATQSAERGARKSEGCLLFRLTLQGPSRPVSVNEPPCAELGRGCGNSFSSTVILDMPISARLDSIPVKLNRVTCPLHLGKTRDHARSRTL